MGNGAEGTRARRGPLDRGTLAIEVRDGPLNDTLEGLDGRPKPFDEPSKPIGETLKPIGGPPKPFDD